MIDFRYHLVSLISVFLALAVGIALGAGPLESTIGDTLTGQVDQLRVEKEELRAELDAAEADVTHAQGAMDAVAPGLLADVLGERRVAVVQVGQVEPEVVEQVIGRLTQAGATVSATAQVAEAWTDPERRAFRQSLAATLVGYLDPAPETDAGTGVELAEALVQGLTGASETDPDVLSEDAQVVLDLLSGEAALVTFAERVTAPADAIVVLAAPAVPAEVDESPAVETQEPTTEEADLLAAQVDAGVAIAVAAQARSTGAVVATGPVRDPGVVSALRTGEDTLGTISTVDAVATPIGQVSVPLALAGRIAGVVGHYGPGTGATAPMPDRVVLPVIVREVTPPEGTTDPNATDPGTTDPNAPDPNATDPAAPGTDTGQG